MVTVAYPRLLRRIQAVLIDSVILGVLIWCALLLPSSFGVDDHRILIVSVVLLIIIFEPFLVSMTGGTIGHHIVKLRVQRAGSEKRLNFFLALLRFVLKTLLGFASLFFVVVSRKHQAIHDMAADSVVVYKSTVKIPQHELLKERTAEDEHNAYASKTRRIIVIIIYIFFANLAYGFWNVFLASPGCMYENVCNEEDGVIILIGGVLFLVASGLFAYFGWKGSLYGCRKKDANAPIVRKEPEL